VLPVTRVDDKPVGSGTPGPTTRKLMALYEALARAGVP
jgi:branched-subunit amino acid aminotransferase/4-amino-4-deoxychorismate lyase